jgi:hypothetical protein
MKRYYIVIISLLGLVITLSVAKAVLYNALSTSGIYVGKVENEISYYKTQNVILSEKLLAASSLNNIAEKAKELGFTVENNLMILKTSNPLAVKP